MTQRSSKVLSYLIWIACLAPIAGVLIWLDMAEASWRGFFVALGGLAMVSLAFELVYGGVARILGHGG